MQHRLQGTYRDVRRSLRQALVEKSLSLMTMSKRAPTTSTSKTLAQGSIARQHIVPARGVAKTGGKFEALLRECVVAAWRGFHAGAFAAVQALRFHNLTSGPFVPSTGSVLGTATCGIVFSALACASLLGRTRSIGGPGG
mgnify:CR=1 FL=1